MADAYNYESTLPGLQHWIRVRDYRENLIRQMPNVDVYLQSELSATDVKAFEADQVVIATGSHWRRDGVGDTCVHRSLRAQTHPLCSHPDDIFSGTEIVGDVLIYDDDHYFMGARWRKNI